MPSDEIRRQREAKRKLQKRLSDDEQEAKAKFMPTPEYIAHMKRIIRAENEAARHGKKQQPMSDDDCDPELEALADKDSMRNGR